MRPKKSLFDASLPLMNGTYSTGVAGPFRGGPTPPRKPETLVQQLPEMQAVLALSSRSRLSSDDAFQEKSAQYKAVEPEQWLQRHPEAGSSWPSWPKASEADDVVQCNPPKRLKEVATKWPTLSLGVDVWITHLRG